MSRPRKKAEAASAAGDDLGGGFTLVEAREHYYEARNQLGTQFSSATLEKVQGQVAAWAKDQARRK